ncbi:hypothetical protein NC651_019396 [Populus alba x Populus x berolinensis]|nr:hypothetical protein NC651_019396 [Populus alba x Populus x berolinensis]
METTQHKEKKQERDQKQRQIPNGKISSSLSFSVPEDLFTDSLFMLGAGTLTTRNPTSFSSINNTVTAPNQRSFIAALRLRRGIGGFNKSPLKHNQDFD